MPRSGYGRVEYTPRISWQDNPIFFLQAGYVQGCFAERTLLYAVLYENVLNGPKALLHWDPKPGYTSKGVHKAEGVHLEHSVDDEYILLP